MVTYRRLTCKECGVLLWSNYSKSILTCPDCGNIDTDIIQDLESRLENAIH
jgi:predicted RNA-binding Zn-ribbon protein involved in translation (DUF1610 family)